MTITCPDCGLAYDDAACSTLCPHDRFLSVETQTQKDLALSLLGRDLEFHSSPGLTVRVQAVGWDGLVTLVGWSGEFAPHLFKVVALVKVR